MKAKLLRKIRKRFSWSYGKKSKQWLLVDHKLKKSYFIDTKFAQKHIKSKKKPPCGWKELKFRLLKFHILRPHYSDPGGTLMYKAAATAIKKSLYKKKKKNANTNKI
tara:strand:+ start:2818 stop:3138 length:321 start_codon:yes stop_codon:yes gene_type:complete